MNYILKKIEKKELINSAISFKVLLNYNYNLIYIHNYNLKLIFDNNWLQVKNYLYEMGIINKQ